MLNSESKKTILTGIFLVFLFTLLLYVSAGKLLNRSIEHSFPYGYLASDPFFHQTRTQGIKDMGSYSTQPFYTAAGFDDVIGAYPPLMSHLAIIFSGTAGLEIYDGIYLLVFLLVVFSALLMYITIEKYSQPVAVLASSLSVFLFSKGLYVPLTWGNWPAILGSFFIIAILWALTSLELKNSYILIAILFTGAALGHTSELVFILMAITLWLGAELLIQRKLLKDSIKALFKGGTIAVILSSYYLLIFYKVWVPAEQQKLFHVFRPEMWGTPYFTLSAFGWTLLLIALGLIIAFAPVKNSKLTFLSFALVILGFANWIGMDFRALQLRFFWPLYLSWFFGLGAYFIVRLITKSKAFLVSMAVSAVFLIIFASTVPNVQTNPGLMLSQEHWDSFMWFKGNTPLNSSVLFFYGDGYNQNSILRNTGRVPYQANMNSMTKMIYTGNVSRYMLIKVIGNDGTRLPYRKGLFSYGFHAVEGFQEEIERDICGFDYYVIDTKTGFESMLPFIQFNLFLRNSFLANNMSEVYSNSIVSILMNNAKGGGCFGA